MYNVHIIHSGALHERISMKNILLITILTILTFPATVFSASGPAGSVETLSVSVISSNVTADVRASGQTSLSQTKFYVEYGPTPEMGRRTTPKNVRTGETSIVTTRLHFLTPKITYYYRAVIEGTAGTVYGETRSFTTGGDDSAYAQGGSTPENTQGESGSGSNTNTGSGSGNTGNISSGAQTGAVGNSISGTGNNSSSVGQSGLLQNPGGFFQRLFDSVTRARPIQLSVAMNPEKPAAREIVEYVVTYTNGSNAPLAPGTLKVVLPDSVVYLADNSGGRTTLSKVAGGQELTLTTQALSAKEKRTMTIMAIASSVVGKTSPTAIASMSYVNAQGSAQNITTNKTQSATKLIAAPAASVASVSQSTASDSGGILPNTFFEWLIFLAVVTTIIVVVRKVMATYQERKKRILEESREVAPAH